MKELFYTVAVSLLIATQFGYVVGNPECTGNSCRHANDPLKHAEHKLNQLTKAKVCDALRDAKVTKAQRGVENALTCTEVAPSLACDEVVRAAEKEYEAALAEKCETPAGSIEDATSKLKAAFMKKMDAVGFKFPFKTIVIEPLHGHADATITMLHGLNFSIANELPRVLNMTKSGSPRGVRVVMMQAPYRTDWTIYGYQGHMWFRMPSNPYDPWTQDMLDEMYATVDKLYRSSRHVHNAFHLDKDRFGFMGFSFGAVTTIATYLNHDVPAAAALSGIVVAPFNMTHQDSAEAKKRPILMVNGVEDEFIKTEWALDASKRLRSFGRNVHQIVMPSLMHSLQPYRTFFLEMGMRFIYDAIGATQQPIPGTDLTEYDIAPVIWSPNDNFTVEE